jgi:hypothetical protein
VDPLITPSPGFGRAPQAPPKKSDDHVRAAFGAAISHGVIGGVAGVALKSAPGIYRATRTANGQQGSQEYMKQYFTQRGWSPEQASGIAANLWAESSGNTKATGDFVHGKATAYGLAQWHPDRQKDFKNYKGKDIHQATLDEQLDFVNHEIQRRGGRDLRKAKTAAEAAAIVSREYEGPKDKEGEATRRGALAQHIYGIGGASSNLASAGRPASGTTTSDDHSTTVTNHVGSIVVQTQATDAPGIARGLNSIFTAYANTGLN